MKTAYRLIDCPVDNLDELYIGTVEYQTFDADDMATHIADMDEPDIDNLYSVYEYTADDNFFKIADGTYIKPTEFVAKHGKETV